MVKSCLINAFLCTVMTDGLGCLDEPAWGGGGWGHLLKMAAGEKVLLLSFFLFFP